MKKLFDKDQVTFAVINIVVYVVLFGTASNYSEELGIQYIINVPLSLIMTAVYLIFSKKNGLTEYFGLCRGSYDRKKYLYYIPFIVTAVQNLWNGAAINLNAAETVTSCIVMACVGFLEEIIFRGFLFRAMAKDNIKSAVIVSSLTFGMGHIVNLLRGHDIIPTLIQIVYAVAIGFMLTVIFMKSGSMLLCIFFHSFFDITSLFANTDISFAAGLIENIILSVICIGYAVYLLKAIPDNKLREA